MLTSLALIFTLGMLLGYLFQKIKLPSLLGMLITGILLGPHALNLIDDGLLSISDDLRQIALIIILTRAGLSLNIKDLKQVGRPALLMCFIPACFEISGTVLIAPKLLGISILEAAILGSVIAAVSPAVIVPRMIALMEKGYGINQSIPQLILAGASVDDIFVIVLFSSFTSLANGGNVTLSNYASIPLSIVAGIAVGAALGFLLSKLFKKIHMRDSAKVMILISIAFLLVSYEHSIKDIFPFSGLLSIMSIGILLLQFYPILSERLSAKYSKLWVAAEVLLFVLVGATVDISFALSAGLKAIILLICVLIFRLIGVFICLHGTKLNLKEKVFCMISYIPKATVQAAIGGIPLSMGLSCGNIVLTVAVLSIIITAPIGAFGIDLSYKHLLNKDD